MIPHALLALAAAASLQPPPLSGPGVDQPHAAPTLVEPAIDGSLRRAEPSPEHAALRLLDLDQDTRRRVDDLLLRRARLLEQFVADNLDLLARFGVASATGDRADQFALLLQAAAALRPVLEPGPLQDQLEPLLPEPRRRAFRALLDEYRDALVRERRCDDPRAPRALILFTEAIASLGREIELAFARLNRSGEILFRYATRGLGLDPHQECAVREAIARYMERGGEEADEAAKRDLFIAVMFVLTEPQRTTLIERFRGR